MSAGQGLVENLLGFKGDRAVKKDMIPILEELNLSAFETDYNIHGAAAGHGTDAAAWIQATAVASWRRNAAIECRYQPAALPNVGHGRLSQNAVTVERGLH